MHSGGAEPSTRAASTRSFVDVGRRRQHDEETVGTEDSGDKASFRRSGACSGAVAQEPVIN